MTKTVEYNSWPLPESLTWKVVSYMNAYRVVVSILLGIAHFGWLAAAAYTFGLPRVVASALLIGYMVFAAFHLFSARNKAANVRFLEEYERRGGAPATRLSTAIAPDQLTVVVSVRVPGGGSVLQAAQVDVRVAEAGER